jgi:apolipoprotein N-acyltransferase
MAEEQPANPRQAAGREADRTDRRERRVALAHLGFALNGHWRLILLAGVSFALMTAIFEPVGWWPLAFVCLVPWCIMLGAATSARAAYWYSFLLGLLFFCVNLAWVFQATGPSFSYALLIMTGYLAVYFPLVACPVRHAIRRRRLPLAVVLPVCWVGSELLRATVASGFPWLFLGHSQYRVLTMIQPADLVGAYGVSFVVAAVNGAIADVILAIIARRRASNPGRNLRRARFSTIFAAVLLLATIIYGQVQLRRDVTSPGPRICVVQGDFLTSIWKPFPGTDEKMPVYLEMLEAAAREAAAAGEPPDLYLLPEAPWNMYLNPEVRFQDSISFESYRFFSEFAQQQNAYVVVGAYTYIPTPSDLLAAHRQYNSAYIFSPDGREPQRYDKIHLVLFGETLPFRFGRLRPVYLWLNRLTPFSKDGTYEWSTFPGDAFHTYEFVSRSQDGKTFRMGIPICYEDVMPYISRAFAAGPEGGKGADILLNVSHDGWFGRGHQQPQHLIASVFRAVENRVPIVRSVNTGVSAFIESSGAVHDVVQGDADHRWPGRSGFGTASVDLDRRVSFYTHNGDWFAWMCVTLWALLYVDYVVVRARTKTP